jgi:quinol monooxygenase YgiN
VPLQVVATIPAKPGSEDKVADVLTELVAATRTESGCLAYELFRSKADPTVFVMIETWQSQEDLDAHQKTPHLQKAFAEAGEHLAGAPSIHPLDAVA